MRLRAHGRAAADDGVFTRIQVCQQYDKVAVASMTPMSRFSKR
jgi:hypothetical protein